MSLIKIKNLVKKYGQKIALDNINLEIKEGEIFGLLGPNGAGKSTAINVICGLLNYDQGDITINNINLKKRSIEAKKLIGLVPQEIAIFDTLTAYENIEFFGKLAGLRRATLKKRVQEALDFVGLSDNDQGVPKSFSGGMKRRLNIACAIVHQPKIIIMDEPTVGIDPQSRKHILESVKMLNKQGSTIIYTSHYMEEAELICDRLAIIDHGKLVAIGTTDELKRFVTNQEKIQIELSDINFVTKDDLMAIPSVNEVTTNNNQLELITDNSQAVLQDVLFILHKKGLKIKGIKLIQPDLETVFLSLTGRTLRD